MAKTVDFLWADAYYREILNALQSNSPSTVTLSTDSCKLLPRRTTFTVCHSLSFSFCPASSTSGPLPVVGREGRGFKIINGTVGNAVCTQLTHPSTHPQAVVHVRRATVLEEKTHVCQTHSYFGFSQDSENGRNQIFSLTDCKIGCLLKSSQCCSRMSSKTLGQISRYQLRE